ncbi:alanine/glycine:cation symporter family protein [Lachnospiraceae bacterium C1.1]|nr:sodium:alanine symporter family protein [Lachnospiraceae bacterium C1.1]
MEAFNAVLVSIDDFVWGIPLIVLIMGTGIFLTVRLGILQFRKLGLALRYMVSNEDTANGEVSSFGALCTALAATIGTGNIVGVATAVMAGGPGAIFWMVMAACLGMATKYAEGLLAVKYRVNKGNGRFLGGPFYYIENGMGRQWKWLAKCFAVFATCVGLMGIGTFTQVNGIASATKSFFDPDMLHKVNILGVDYSVVTVITSVIVAFFVALVVIGGIKRIANVSSVIVPFMAVIYVVVCTAILLFNFRAIPSAIVSVFEGAFGLRAAAGGAFGAMFVAMQKGVARGIFSNESGLGSAPIAAAAAQTEEPVRQGLVSMTGTFIDTVCICTLTGLTILVTGAYDISLAKGLEGVDVTSTAFLNGLPWNSSVGPFILMVCLVFFAFTTILGWDYYSERSLEYLFDNMMVVKIYRWLYIFAVLIGPFFTVSEVWTIADIFNALMAIPNLIALLALNGVIVSETKAYFAKIQNKKV